METYRCIFHDKYQNMFRRCIEDEDSFLKFNIFRSHFHDRCSRNGALFSFCLFIYKTFWGS